MNLWTITLALVSGGQSAPTLTLDEAIEIAIQNAYAIRTADSRAQQARDLVRAAERSAGFAVNGSGQFSIYSDSDSSGVGKNTSTFGSANGSVSLTFPIDINGNIRRNVSAFEYGLLAAEANKTAEIVAIKSSVREAYNAILQAEALVEVSRQSLESAQERLRNVELRQQVGELATVDVLTARTQVALAETNLTESRNQALLAKQSLNTLLARAVDAPFETQPYASQALDTAPPALETKALLDYAMNVRPDVAAFTYRLKGLEKQTELQKNALRPTLGFGASYTQFYNKNDVFGTPKNQTQVGLQMSWPIFDGGVNAALVRGKEEDEVQAKIALEQIRSAAALEIQQALTNLINARARLEASATSVQTAEEAFRLISLRFREGEAIQEQVIDAQASLTQARANQVAARYDLLTAYARLQRALATDDVSAIVNR
ncbi:MAG: TolC family protein [Fimbriimonadaceae bacterium]